MDVEKIAEYDLESYLSCMPPATISYHFFVVYNVLLLMSQLLTYLSSCKGGDCLSSSVETPGDSFSVILGKKSTSKSVPCSLSCSGPLEGLMLGCCPLITVSLLSLRIYTYI